MIGLALGTMYFWAGRAQPVPRDTVEGTGTELTVVFIGSECQSSSRVEAVEHEDRVVITAYEGVRARSCSDVGVRYDLTVTLDERLGERELINGACAVDQPPRSCKSAG
ncbi:hypothetical protein [Nocardioides sp. B-3]|uniref:hypothetical protein n=1 Tax=Nocardioides sp. B-3 TaxID=2895565 RepID=UPI002152B022|nr:hypothetical protein [Nocardioides sp. B-3]UUZ58891.1 hypothetical protein LP418_22970 [Nocardioides sp. B-3]